MSSHRKDIQIKFDAKELAASKFNSPNKSGVGSFNTSSSEDDEDSYDSMNQIDFEKGRKDDGNIISTVRDRSAQIQNRIKNFIKQRTK